LHKLDVGGHCKKIQQGKEIGKIKMKKIITRNINGKKILVLFFLTTIVYIFMLTTTVPKVMNYAGGMMLLDVLPTGYSADYVDSLLNALGTDGRHAYLFQQIPIDFIFPFLFGITFCLLFVFIINKLGKQDSFLFYFSFVPVLAGLFDYFENIGIITILKNYPDNSLTMLKMTSIFTIVKSTLITIYFVALIVALMSLLIKHIISRNKKQRTKNR
jgi:hypothetical protein